MEKQKQKKTSIMQKKKDTKMVKITHLKTYINKKLSLNHIKKVMIKEIKNLQKIKKQNMQNQAKKTVQKIKKTEHLEMKLMLYLQKLTIMHIKINILK